MSVLETVTVDNVTYDMHDPKVGSGTLSTTAQTLIPAVNEVKSGLTTVSGKTDVIGSGALNTTSQTLIGAVNELTGKLEGITCTTQSFTVKEDSSVPTSGYGEYTATKNCILFFVLRYVVNSGYSSGHPSFQAQYPYRGQYSYSLGAQYSSGISAGEPYQVTLASKTSYGNATQTCNLVRRPFFLNAGDTMRYWLYSSDARIISGKTVYIDRYLISW